MMITGYAAQVPGSELQPIEYSAPALSDLDVRVSVTHCGVCHTDIQALENYYSITKYPFVPGHEIVGYVSELGSKVSDLREGDRVGIGWQARSCGQCDWCEHGETQLCMDIEQTTVMVPYGGFSSSIVADHRFVYQLPNHLPSQSAAVLMCAGVTVYRVLSSHAPHSGLRVAIVGVGGLGHLALQFSRAFGFETTAISSSPEKEREALALGANHFVNPKDYTAMRRFDYTHDLLICTANAGIDWNILLMTLKKRGQVTLVGFPDISMNSTDLVAHELTLTGSLIANPTIMRSMLRFAQKHDIVPQVELMPMVQVNEAIDRIKKNLPRYRIVLTNDYD